MKLAFLIAAHAHPRLLVRLVRRLQSPASSIFIHIDKKVDIRSFESAFRAENIRGVHWVARIKSGWGTFGQVRASLSLLQEALATDREADRFVLLSGQDYPLLPLEKMVAFFEANKTTDFLTYSRMPWERWGASGGFDRLQRHHFALGRYAFSYPSDHLPGSRLIHAAYRACQLLLPIKRALPEDIAFYGGSNWWNLTRNTAEEIFAYLKSHPEFYRIFRFTVSADEIFFQTILLNAIPHSPRENNDLRCAFWDGRRQALPATVQIEDFEEIAASGKFFTRKVDPDFSLPLLDRIDRELLQCPENIDNQPKESR